MQAVNSVPQEPWLQPRDSVAREIYDELVDSDTTAVVLTGIAGLGKAKLAELVCREAEKRSLDGGRFPGGVWKKEITHNDTFVDLAREILNILKKPDPKFAERKPQEKASMLFGAISTANPPMLITLMRFDQFLDEQSGKAVEEEVEEWLNKLNSHASGSRVLLTSSILPTLKPDNVRVKNFDTPGISLDDGVALLQKRLQKRDLEDTDRNLREAVKRCGGHVGALEMLSALLKLHGIPLSHLLTRKDYMHLWTENTAKEIFDSIWIRLNNNQRYVLQSLSVYRVPVEGEAIQRLSLDDSKTNPLSILQDLIRQRLVQADQGQYSLHSALRTYIWDKWIDKKVLAQAPTEKLRMDSTRTMSEVSNQALAQAHIKAAFYFSEIKSKFPGIGKRAKVADIQPIIEEAWHRSQAQQPRNWRKAFELLRREDIFNCLEQWRQYRELFDLCNMLLPVEKWQALPEEKASLYEILGRLFRRIGQYQEAEQRFKESLDFYESEKNKQAEILEINFELMQLYREAGLSAKAKEQGMLILALADQLGGDKGRRLGSRTCKLVADILYEEGNLQEAETWLDAALDRTEQSPMNDYGEQAKIKRKKGDIYREQGDNEQAFEFYREAQRLYEEVKDTHGQAGILNKLGEIYREQGDVASALQSHQQAYDLYKAIPDLQGKAESRIGGGDAFLIEGKQVEARQYFEEAMQLCQEIDDDLWGAISINNRGRVSDIEGNLSAALKDYEGALKIVTVVRGKGYKRVEGWILHNRAIVYQKEGNKQQALQYFLEALKAHQEVNDRKAEGITLIYLGQFYKREGEVLLNRNARKQEADAQFRQALTYYRSALVIHFERKNWMCVVPALLDTGVVKINLDAQASGLAYLLCAQNHDQSYLASRFSGHIEASIDKLKKVTKPEIYQRMLSGYGSRPCGLVKTSLTNRWDGR
jgi:tetratricopeptide (TPR) repeat protein